MSKNMENTRNRSIELNKVILLVKDQKRRIVVVSFCCFKLSRQLMKRKYLKEHRSA